MSKDKKIYVTLNNLPLSALRNVESALRKSAAHAVLEGRLEDARNILWDLNRLHDTLEENEKEGDAE